MFWHILRWKSLIALAYQEYSFDYVNYDVPSRHTVECIEKALECEDKAFGINPK